MSCNLARTDCYFCGSTVGVVGPSRPKGGREDQYGYHKMVVADAECFLCKAKYLAWVFVDPSGVTSFHDLSFRSTFNDEPSVADLPLYDVEKVAVRPWSGGFYDSMTCSRFDPEYEKRPDVIEVRRQHRQKESTVSRTMKLMLFVAVSTAAAWLWARLGGWGTGEESFVLIEGAFAESVILVIGVLRLTGTGRRSSTQTPPPMEVETDQRRISAGHDARTGPCACGAWHNHGV